MSTWMRLRRKGRSGCGSPRLPRRRQGLTTIANRGPAPEYSHGHHGSMAARDGRRRRTHRPLFPAGGGPKALAQRGAPGSTTTTGTGPFRDTQRVPACRCGVRARGPSSATWTTTATRTCSSWSIPRRTFTATTASREGVARFTDVTPIAGVALDGLCKTAPCQPRVRRGSTTITNGKSTWCSSTTSTGATRSALKRRRLLFPGLLRPRQRTVLFRKRGERHVHGYDGRSERWEAGRDGGHGGGPGRRWLGRHPHRERLDTTAVLHNQGDGSFRNVAARLGWRVQPQLDGDPGRRRRRGWPNGTWSSRNFRGESLSLYLQRTPGAFTYATSDNGLDARRDVTGWGVAVAGPRPRWLAGHRPCPSQGRSACSALR